jgi:seryl-tRNA(Sec) selenium transferase
MLSASLSTLKNRADRLAGILNCVIDSSKALINVVRESVNIGDDVLPLYKMDSYRVIVEPKDKDPYKLINYLQTESNPKIITIRHHDAVSFDMRTIDEPDIESITVALSNYFE